MPDLTPNPFDYVKPDEPALEDLGAVNLCVKTLYAVMLQHIPDSRERSVAITKLQEVRMWANCAIVMDQKRSRG